MAHCQNTDFDLLDISLKRIKNKTFSTNAWLDGAVTGLGKIAHPFVTLQRDNFLNSVWVARREAVWYDKKTKRRENWNTYDCGCVMHLLLSLWFHLIWFHQREVLLLSGGLMGVLTVMKLFPAEHWPQHQRTNGPLVCFSGWSSDPVAFTLTHKRTATSVTQPGVNEFTLQFGHYWH